VQVFCGWIEQILMLISDKHMIVEIKNSNTLNKKRVNLPFQYSNQPKNYFS